MHMFHFLLFQRTSNFDLYIVFDPLISKPQAIMLGNKLIRWINVRDWITACICQLTSFLSLPLALPLSLHPSNSPSLPPPLPLTLPLSLSIERGG